MKTIINRYFASATVLYIVIIVSVVLFFSSCAPSKNWYSSRHDGCQQSGGFAGYGNK